ncbi:MAG: hypothetical protein QOF76_5439 [Solirubrobacteraceae bacterium]|jgi:hypothetical protein|nr:hypothetical protein [Solirubrobacteraceae bacterium]
MATRRVTPDREKATAQVAPRSSGAVLFWAAVGTGALLLAATTYLRWIASDDFRASDPGPDPYKYLWVLRSVEAVSVLFVLGFAWRCLMRPLIRERQFTFDGKLLLGLMIAYVVDPSFNAFNHAFAMNAHSVNLGAWGNQIPFFTAPGQGRLAEALLWAAPLYVYCGIAAAMLGGKGLDLMRRRLPGASTVGLYFTLYLAFVVGDFIFEFCLFVLPQLYVFPGVKRDLSLFAGTLHQFPVYHSIFAGVFAGSITWLRDSRDDTGRSAIERGADHLSRRARGTLSFLAITGFATMAALFGYFLPFSYASMSADTYIDLPSYLSTGAYCGDRGRPECPAQYLNRLQQQAKEKK